MPKKKKSSRSKVSKKKRAKKAAPKKSKKTSKKARSTGTVSSVTTSQPQTNERRIGEVEDYFSRIGVIALTLADSLAIGETIHVKGHTTDLTQRVDSMQIEHQPVQAAKKGDSVGIKVNDKCRKGDTVYKVA